jgi:uncharacterized protein YkwD
MGDSIPLGRNEAVAFPTVNPRRPPSALTLGLLLAIAVLAPVLVYVMVGVDGDGGDEVAASGGAEQGAASLSGGAPDIDGGGPVSSGRSVTTTARPTTTAEATTSTTEAEATTTTEAPATTTTAEEPPEEAPTTTAPPTEAPEAATAAEQVFTLVNEARAAAGCPALSVDGHLDQAALLHSTDMAAREYMDHVTPEGQNPSDRARAAGYTGQGVGENIAMGYPDAAAVMDGWMNSEGHRANIENCAYRTIGIGVAADGWYWTQMFGM